MEKYREDQWSRSNTVISFLRYSHSTASEQETLYSPICGFGWRFSLIAEAGGRVLHLRFDPHILADASLGTIQIVTSSTFQLDKYDSHFGVGGATREYTFSYPFGTTSRREGVTDNWISDASQSLGQYDAPQTQPNVLGRYEERYFEVKISFDRALGFSFHPLPPWVKKTVKEILSGQEVTDIKFYLFSRRSTSSGLISAPKAIFANAALLRGHSEALDTMLFGDHFQESAKVALDEERLVVPLNAEEYDYEDDSDLEEEDSDVSDFWRSPSFRPSPDSVVLPVPLSKEESMEYKTEAESSDTAQCSVTQAITPEPMNSPPADVHVASETLNVTKRYGRTFAVNGHAYRTWQAFLYYLITGEITFSPLRSAPHVPFRNHHDGTSSEGSIVCSPKSMYRLADKYGIRELSELALEQIQSNIKEANVMGEAFTLFTSWYRPVAVFISSYIASNMTPKLARQLDEKMKEVFQGRHPHGFDVVSLLLQKLHGQVPEPLRKTAGKKGKKKR